MILPRLIFALLVATWPIGSAAGQSPIVGITSVVAERVGIRRVTTQFSTEIAGLVGQLDHLVNPMLRKKRPRVMPALHSAGRADS